MNDEKVIICGNCSCGNKIIDLLSEYFKEGVVQSPPEFIKTVDEHFWDLADTSPKPQPDYKTVYRYDKIEKRKERYRKLNKKVNK